MGQEFSQETAYDVVQSKAFRKDVKRLRKSGYRLEKLLAVIDTIQQNIPLSERHQQHSLRGDFQGYEECHVEPDWLLIYKKNLRERVLQLSRTGTHAQLFGK